LLYPEPGLDPAETEFFGDLQVLLLRAPKKGRRLSKRITRICAVDAAYSHGNVTAVATVVVSGRVTDQTVYSGHFTFPYTSGLLYLHEGPFVVEAVRRLKEKPELVCFDAHGLAHPRLAGLAVICGMVLEIPSIGIAKSLLIGEVTGERETETPQKILHDGRTVGLVTRIEGVIRYWSPGYSVATGQLQTLIGQYGSVCLNAMAASHQEARRRIRTAVGQEER
jgi:deoxyribonuclease V